MSNSAPSHEEFMVNPGKYEDFELIIDDAGKFKVVSKRPDGDKISKSLRKFTIRNLGDSSRGLLYICHERKTFKFTTSL